MKNEGVAEGVGTPHLGSVDVRRALWVEENPRVGIESKRSQIVGRTEKQNLRGVQ